MKKAHLGTLLIVIGLALSFYFYGWRLPLCLFITLLGNNIEGRLYRW